MLRLSVKDLKKGMIVAQSIYNNHGGSYLVRGSAITPEYIRQLQKIGIPTVNVTSADPNFQLLPPEDVVQETTRIDAIQHVFEAFQSVEQEGRLDAEAMERVSDNILIDLIQRKENLIQLTDIRLHDTYTFAHSVNVAILSAMLGLHCHYTKKDLTLLTLGALLHDLGKIGIPAEILTKNTRLTDEEFATIKQHPELGAKRIHEMDHILPSTSLLAAIAPQLERQHQRAGAQLLHVVSGVAQAALATAGQHQVPARARKRAGHKAAQPAALARLHDVCDLALPLFCVHNNLPVLPQTRDAPSEPRIV